MTSIHASLQMKDWKEATVFDRADGVKVTRVEAEFQYSGDLEGGTTLAFLLYYRADGTGTYSGWERFTGTLRGAQGEAVFAHQGVFDPKVVSAQVETVAGSGTGALAGVTVRFPALMEGHGPYPLTLEILSN